MGSEPADQRSFTESMGNAQAVGLSFTKHGTQSFPCVFQTVPVKSENLKKKKKESIQLTKQNSHRIVEPL